MRNKRRNAAKSWIFINFVGKLIVWKVRGKCR